MRQVIQIVRCRVKHDPCMSSASFAWARQCLCLLLSVGSKLHHRTLDTNKVFSSVRVCECCEYVDTLPGHQSESPHARRALVAWFFQLDTREFDSGNGVFVMSLAVSWHRVLMASSTGSSFFVSRPGTMTKTVHSNLFPSQAITFCILFVLVSVHVV